MMPGEIRRSELLSLLDATVQEQQYFLTAHQNRIAFYSSIVSAVFAATIAGVFEATSREHYLLLLIGPILIFGLCAIARSGTERFYLRFLEAITVQGKLEEALGLDTPVSRPKRTALWQSEPLVPTRHVESRRSTESSDAFIKKYMRRGYQRATARLLYLFQVVAVVVAVVLVMLGARTPWGGVAG